jgi:hypothetical protein
MQLPCCRLLNALALNLQHVIGAADFSGRVRHCHPIDFDHSRLYQFNAAPPGGHTSRGQRLVQVSKEELLRVSRDLI